MKHFDDTKRNVPKSIVDVACRILDKAFEKDTEMPLCNGHWSIAQDCLLIVERAGIRKYPALKRSQHARKQRRMLMADLNAGHIELMERVLEKGHDPHKTRIQYKNKKLMPITAEIRSQTVMELPKPNFLQVSQTKIEVPKQIKKPINQIAAKPIQSQVPKPLALNINSEKSSYIKFLPAFLSLISKYEYKGKIQPLSSIYEDILTLAAHNNYNLRLITDQHIEINKKRIEDLQSKGTEFWVKLLKCLTAAQHRDPNYFTVLGTGADFCICSTGNEETTSMQQEQQDIADITIQVHNGEAIVVPTLILEMQKLCSQNRLSLDEVARKANSVGCDWERMSVDEEYKNTILTKLGSSTQVETDWQLWK